MASDEVPDGSSVDNAVRPRWRHGAAWRQYNRGFDSDWRQVSALPGKRLESTRSTWLTLDHQIIGDYGEVLLRRKAATITLATGQVLHTFADRSVPEHGQQLVDSFTGNPVLWLRSSHISFSAAGYVLLPDQGRLSFPVRGTRPGNAVMTAVDESGTTMLWFRRTGRSKVGPYEVIVSPDCAITPDILCVIAMTRDWLTSFFRVPADGGG